MPWRFWLIDVPAFLLDAMYFVHRLIVAVLSTICIALLFIALGLWFGLGIRWGW